MKNQKPTLEEFCRIYPELLAQAREYAEGTIVDPQEHDDAVEIANSAVANSRIEVTVSKTEIVA